MQPYAMSVTHMHTAEHLLKLKENIECVCVCVCVRACRRVGAGVCRQHLLWAREIVSECHIKNT